MANPAFAAVTGGVVALVAATPKSVLAVIPASTKSLTVTEIDVTFDGVSAAAVPVLVEICASTGGAAGTSSAVTPNQVRGPLGAAVTSTAKKNYTVEPTTLTVLRELLVSPTSGMVVQFPLGRELEAVGNTGASLGGIVVRCTAPAGVNVRASIEFEE